MAIPSVVELCLERDGREVEFFSLFRVLLLMMMMMLAMMMLAMFGLATGMSALPIGGLCLPLLLFLDGFQTHSWHASVGPTHAHMKKKKRDSIDTSTSMTMRRMSVTTITITTATVTTTVNRWEDTTDQTGETS